MTGRTRSKRGQWGRAERGNIFHKPHPRGVCYISVDFCWNNKGITSYAQNKGGILIPNTGSQWHLQIMPFDQCYVQHTYTSQIMYSMSGVGYLFSLRDRMTQFGLEAGNTWMAGTRNQLAPALLFPAVAEGPWQQLLTPATTLTHVICGHSPHAPCGG